MNIQIDMIKAASRFFFFYLWKTGKQGKRNKERGQNKNKGKL